MSRPIAFLDGNFVDAAEAVLPVTDWGFLQGVTVAEQLRTFGGVLYRPSDHLERFFHGLRIVGWEMPLDRDRLSEVIDQVVGHNHALLDTGDDLGVTLFSTPGIYPSYSTAGSPNATLCVHTYPLPFRQWSHRYQQGVSLRSVSIQQVPSACWPADLKCRSRMHYFLAQKEASEVEPGSTALLCNADGTVSETPTANVVAYFRDAGLVSAQRGHILPGISMRALAQIAEPLGMQLGDQPLTLNDLANADELLVTSTPYCVLPVSRLDGKTFECPGPQFARLVARWSDEVGLDIVAQSATFADR